MAKQDEFDERQVAPPDNARVGDDASPLDPAQSQSETSTQEYSQEETFQTELDKDPALKDSRGETTDINLVTVIARGDYIDGLLNPIPTRAITELTVDKNHTTFLGLSKNYALKQYENNIIKNAGFIKAIALYAWEEEQGEVYREGPTGLEPTTKTVLKVKARIPELHVALPEPAILPLANNPNFDADWVAVNAHPTFLASDTSVAKMSDGLPQPGDIIYVDFEHRLTQTGPIYLGPLSVNFAFNLPSPPELFETIPVELDKPLIVDTFAGLEFDLIQGRPFTGGKVARTKEIDTVVIHESVVGEGTGPGKIDGGRDRTYNVLERRRLAIHYSVGKDGTVHQHEDPAEFVTFHGGGGDEGGGMNGRSIGIEMLNRWTAKSSETVDNRNIISKPRFGQGKGNYVNPPQIQHEACYRLLAALVKKFPKLKMQFFGSRQGSFFFTKTPGRASGITAHGNYVARKSDGFSTAMYCACRARGYSEQESYEYLVQALNSNSETSTTKGQVSYLLPPAKQAVFSAPDTTEPVV